MTFKEWLAKHPEASRRQAWEAAFDEATDVVYRFHASLEKAGSVYQVGAEGAFMALRKRAKTDPR